jgi:hypothetical protein
MQIGKSVPPGFEVLGEAEIFTHGHLPIAAAHCRRLGLVELVDRMAPTQVASRPGLVFQTMALDVLSGRTPLYRVEQFLAIQDVELLRAKPFLPMRLAIPIWRVPWTPCLLRRRLCLWLLHQQRERPGARLLEEWNLGSPFPGFAHKKWLSRLLRGVGQRCLRYAGGLTRFDSSGN